MILRALKVERFGGLNPGAWIEEFGPDLTVVHGPNGAGKSTLFRALVYALYQRHGISARDAVEQIQPRGCDVAPRVEVTFEVAGVTWRVTKQFLKRASVDLARLEGGVFKVVVEGPEAEERLQQILGSEPSAKGLAGPRLRGIGEILLVDQGRVPMEGLSPLAQDRLRVVVGQVGTTQGAHDLVAKIEKQYAEVFGKTGVRDASALARLESEVKALGDALAGLRRERDLADEWAAKLQHLGDEEQSPAADDLATFDAEIAQAHDLKIELGRKIADRDALKLAWDRAGKDLEGLRSRREELHTARADRARVARDQEAADVRLRQLEEAVAAAIRLRDEAAENVAALMRRDTELLDAKAGVDDARRARDAMARIPDLEDRLARYETLCARARETRQEMESRRRPTEAEIARLRQEFHALQAAEIQIGRLDVRVRVTAEAAIPLEIGPERIALADHEAREVVTGDGVELRIPGVARVEVRAPGSEERARLLRDLAARRATIQDATIGFGSDDLETLEALALERRRLDTDLGRHEVARAAIFSDDRAAGEARVDLASARSVKSEMLERHPEWKGAPPDAAQIVAGERSVAADRRSLAALMEKGEEIRKLRQQAVEAAAADIQTQQGKVRERDVGRALLDDKVGRLEREDPDDAAREKRIADAEAEHAAMRRRLDALGAEIDALGDPAVRIARLTEERRARENARVRAVEERAKLTDRLDQFRQRGIWKEVGRVEADLAQAASELDRARLEADALKLLRDVLAEEQAAAVETAVRPVAARLSRMARYVFGPAARPGLRENLGPERLALDGTEIPAALLSAGTQDQIALLTRVALGELYAESCGRHAFVLDDPLVNSDRERRGRLLEIFAASRSLQIIIFTCSPEHYAGLPPDRTRSIDIEDAKRRLSS